MSADIPSTYKAVVLHEYGKPLSLDTLPTPVAEPGSAVIKVLASIVDPSEKHRLHIPRNPYFSQETPFIPGNGAVGRIAALPKDATSLQLGQLVLLESFVRGRDDPTSQALRAVYEGPSPAAKKLTHTEGLWRDGFWAEYVRAPLESCWRLDEKALLGPVSAGGLGYKISDLPYLIKHAVAYGGFRAIDLKAGETIVITPATGNHGGAAVQVASAMGARVIAVGRNADTLRRLSENIPRVQTVNLTGDVAEDTKLLSQFGTIDAFMDFTPATMEKPLHLKSCVAAVRTYGRGVLMGYPYGDLTLPYGLMVAKNIGIKAQYMYEAADVRGLIKLAERGLLKLGDGSGVDVIDGYALEQFDEAVTKAADQQAWGRQVIFEPFKE